MPLGWISRPILRSALAIAGRKVVQGNRTLVYLATAEDVAGITGKYFVDEAETNSSPASYDIRMASLLWELSDRLTDHSPSGPSTRNYSERT
jgi:hypothetical protein